MSVNELNSVDPEKIPKVNLYNGAKIPISRPLRLVASEIWVELQPNSCLIGSKNAVKPENITPDTYIVINEQDRTTHHP